MNPINKVKSFLWGIAIKKGVKQVAKAIASFLIAKAIAPEANEEAIAVLILGGAEVAKNFFKRKFPEQFGWL